MASADGWAAVWAVWWATQVWQLALLAGLVGAAAWVARKASPRVRLALWWLVFAKLLLPPTLGAPWGVGAWALGPLRAWTGTERAELVLEEARVVAAAEAVRPRSPEELEAETLMAAALAAPGDGWESIIEPPEPRAQMASRPITPEQWLFLAWLAGAAGMMAWALAGHARLMRKLRQAEAVTEGPLRIELERLAQRIGVEAPDMLLMPEASGPFIAGLVRPRLVLPAGLLETIGAERLRHVLLHELAHAKRRDLVWSWVQMAGQAAAWFHPLVWWAGARLRHERECACDELAVAAGGIEPRQYGESILQVILTARARPASALGLPGVFERHARLQERMETIMRTEGQAKRVRPWGWALVAMFALVALPMGAAPVRPVEVKNRPEQVAKDFIDATARADQPAMLLLATPEYREEAKRLATMPDADREFLAGLKVDRTIESDQWALVLTAPFTAIGETHEKVVGIKLRNIEGSWFIDGSEPFPPTQAEKNIEEFKDWAERQSRPASYRRVGPQWDRSFVTDPALVGVWHAVDFVSTPDKFQPGKKLFSGDMILKDITFTPDGKTIGDASATGPWRWTKGYIWHAGSHTEADYQIRQIGGQPYLFMEWISGDVTMRGKNPGYYVLSKAAAEQGVPSPAPLVSYIFKNARDSSKYDIHGNLHGPTPCEDQNGTDNSAFFFDGMDDYITFDKQLPDMQEMTICAWVFAESQNVWFTDADWEIGNDVTIGFGPGFVNIRADKQGFRLWDNVPVGISMLGVWRHICWTMTAEESRVYVNGVIRGTEKTGGTNVGFHNFILGTHEYPQGQMGWGGYWKGRIASLEIYDRALSDAEARAASEGPEVEKSAQGPFAGMIEVAVGERATDKKQSYGGAGAAVRLNLRSAAPADVKTSELRLAGVRLYAGRYGAGYDPAETKFGLLALDGNAKVLWRHDFPYSLFKYDEGWVDLVLDTPMPIEKWLNEKGELILGFDPLAHQTKGIYFYYEESDDAPRSLGVVPGEKLFDTPGRRWIVKAYFTTAEEAPAKADAAMVAPEEAAKAETTPASMNYVQQEIDRAVPGGVVRLPAGTFPGGITITKPVTLKGAGWAETIVELQGDEPAILIRGAQDVRLEDMHVRWSLKTTDARIEHPAAVAVRDARVTIARCRFQPIDRPRETPYGVLVAGKSEASIEGCIATGFAYTIMFIDGANGRVVDCALGDAGHSVVTMHDNSQVEIARCSLERCGYHAVRNTGGTMDMHDNIVQDCTRAGAYLGNKSAHGRIYNNLFANNNGEIWAYAQSDVAIERNVFYNSRDAALIFWNTCKLNANGNSFVGSPAALRSYVRDKGAGVGIGLSGNHYWGNREETQVMEGEDRHKLVKSATAISGDPIFKNPEAGDFTPQTGSALLRDGKGVAGLSDPNLIAQVAQKFGRKFAARADTAAPAAGSGEKYIIAFGPKPGFTPRTAGELLEAFNEKLPEGVKTRMFRTRNMPNKGGGNAFIGYIVVDTERDRMMVLQALQANEKLVLVDAEKATVEKLEKLEVAGVADPPAEEEDLSTTRESFVLSVGPKGEFNPRTRQELAEAVKGVLEGEGDNDLNGLVIMPRNNRLVAWLSVTGKEAADRRKEQIRGSEKLHLLQVEKETPVLRRMLEEMAQRPVDEETTRTTAQSAPPRIVKMEPAAGAIEVDSNLSAIRVTFDRDMADGFSWTGGGEYYPPIPKGQNPRWIDRRTCELPVRLEAGHFYRVGINSTSHQNFRSADGVSARPTAIWFATQGADAATLVLLDPPRVVTMTPANGATGVDPATSELRVTFNVPMGGGFSWTGAGEHYPEIAPGGRPQWSADGKSCRLPVKLKPNWDYRLGLNSPSHQNFNSAAGLPLEPVVWTFRTGPGS